MLVLTKSALALMVSFLLATVVALALIPLLKKIKAGQRLSIYLESIRVFLMRLMILI